MDIPIGSTAGFIGLGLLLIGGFMILAGFDIIRIEKITVRKGRTTWMLGIIFAAIGLLLFLPEITSSPRVTNAEVPTESVSIPAVPSITDSGSLTEWMPVNFSVTNTSLWRDAAEGRYSAIGSEDAFAWSTETYHGDIIVRLDLESPESKSSGCVVIYGNGQGLSYGNLIFCVDWDGYGLEKHTIYHQGENRLAWYPSDVNLKARVYSVTLEVIGDTASMYVNGEKILSSVFDTQEIDRDGRIGLLKKWFDPEVTFSNIRIRSLDDN